MPLKATVEKIGDEKVGDEYIVTVNGEQTIQFVYDPDDTRIKIVESTDKEATALVYFEFIEGYTERTCRCFRMPEWMSSSWM